MMNGSRLYLVLLATAVSLSTISSVLHSGSSYKSIGCYRDSRQHPRPLSKLLANLRPLINSQWNNFQHIVAICAKLAENKGYQYFGVEFYGECWVSNNGDGYDKDGKSSRCIDGVGRASSVYVYRLEDKEHPLPCGLKPPMSRIIGGSNAGPGAWPWQADILVFNKDKNVFVHRCGGTLIDPLWVVTAAHCVFNNIDPKNYRIMLGEHDRSKKERGELELPVQLVHMHSRFFTEDYGYDIALMKLAAPAIISHTIGPICLPAQYQPVELDKTCFVTGWGMTKYGGPHSNVLQQAKLPLVSDEQCVKVNSALRKVNQFTMLCAGYGGDSSISGCHGDSGGPFVCQEKDGRWFLRGVVSWGDQKCSGKYYSVFTRISSLIDWISCKMNTGPLQPPAGCVDAHYYCKQWKAKGFCGSAYLAHMLKGYYCKKTCEAC